MVNQFRWKALVLGLFVSINANASFSNIYDTIFELKCIFCHDEATPTNGNVNLSSYEVIMGSAAPQLVIPGDPEASILYRSIKDGRMPLGLDPLSNEEIELVRQWIADGAVNSQTPQ